MASIPRWFRLYFSSRKRRIARKKGHAPARTFRSAWLRLEILEDRMVPSGDLFLARNVIPDIQSTTIRLTRNTGSNPSVYGQVLSFTATVTPQTSGTPTGTVTFYDDGVSLGTALLNQASPDTATLVTSTLPVGTDTLTAVYGGDANFSASPTSAGVRQTVNKSNSTLTLSSSSNPSTFGQSVTFTATVSAGSPGSGTPTGTVTFYENGVSVATGSLNGAAPDTATFTTSALAVGTATINAIYAGDANFSAASASARLFQTVTQASTATTLALTSGTNPSTFGQSVTFTATVSVTSPGSGTPTGTVTFYENGASIGTGTLNGAAADTATFVTATLPAGTDSITASYGGDTNFAAGPASTALTQTVSQSSSTTTVNLTSGTNPSVFGQSLTFTATVTGTGAGTPTGTVTFVDRTTATTLGTQTLSGGSASLGTTTELRVPRDVIVVDYSGDSNFTASTSAGLTQTVNKDGSTQSLSSSVNPSVFGQTVTFTATITALSPGSGTPTGKVAFDENGSNISGPVTLSGGSATFSTTFLTVGTENMTVVYSGDPNFSNGISPTLTQTVERAGTTTTITVSSLDPSTLGQSVTFTASVTPQFPGGDMTGETVVFLYGTTTIGTGTLDGTDQASMTTAYASLPAGTDGITAVYGGDANYLASTSPAFSQTVMQASTTIAVTASSVNPSTAGEGVTFTASVATQYGGVATGSVTFYYGGISIGTGTLGPRGGAFMTTPYALLPAGTDDITVVYVGDANFTESTSAAFPQTVEQASTTTTVTASSVNPSTFDQGVIFTASVSSPFGSGGSLAGETVTFFCGGTSIGSGTIDGTDQATMTTAYMLMPAGTDTITAVYGGDANFAASTSAAFLQTVQQANTVTTVTASSANPSPFGQGVTFTASLTQPYAGMTPAGEAVTFFYGGTSIGSGTLDSSDQASMTTPYGALPVGTDAITAVYGGDANFAGSTSAAFEQTVNESSTPVTLTSSANPAVFGESVTFSTTVGTEALAATGTVSFLDGSTTLATATLTGGSAIYSTTSLALGTHSVEVVYGGDANYGVGASSVLTETVGQASSATTLSTSLDPSVFGQSVTFSATVSAVSPGTGAPTGTIVFEDGGNALGTITLSGGSGTLATSVLYAAIHSITVVYAGDANFLPSTSSILSQTVMQASTSTALTSAPDPSTFGQSVTFTTTVSAVSPGAGTPSGVVTLDDGGATLATATLSGGSATFFSNSIPAGTNSITVVYGGDANFALSTSNLVSQTVSQARTTTTVMSSANPSAFGQGVTFTATVSPIAPGKGTASGTVVFKDGPATLGTATLSAGQASFTTFNLAVATHKITAIYAGDANFGSSTTGLLNQTVTEDASVATVTSSSNPSATGAIVLFVATVSAGSPGSGFPTGQVAFVDGSTTLAVRTLNASDQASFATSSLSNGSHSITAVYLGDANFVASTSAVLTQFVGVGSTVTTVTAGTNPSTYGETVSFTATVRGSGGTPTGSVTFVDTTTGVTLGTSTLSGGSASLSASTQLRVLRDVITVTYGGSANFAPSSGAVVQTVDKDGTATLVTASPIPSVFGQIVTYVATVSPNLPGSGTPTGTVAFVDTATDFTLGTMSLSGGNATFTYSTLSAGTHTITAIYGGDANFQARTFGLVTVTISQDSTTSSVAASPSPSAFGQAVTFTATVSANSPGSGTPSGTVAFTEGTITLGTATLSGGSASFSTAVLAVGTQSITVAYSGDTNFISSSSSIEQAVGQAPSTVTVASGPNSSIFGEPVTILATVTPQFGGAPTGTLTFIDTTTGTTLGTAALNNGTASLMASSQLESPSDVLTVTYSGDANFVASSGQTIQTVNPAETSTSVIASPDPSTYGETVTLSVTVSPQILGTPTGTVTFVDTTTGATLGTQTLAGGSATFLAAAQLVVPSDVITVVYEGDANFGTSSGETTQTVGAAGSVTTVASSANPSTVGQTVTITATVSNAMPAGAGIPTGIATFVDMTTGITLGVQTLSGGSALVTVSTQLVAPSDVISVTYSGDANFTGSSTTLLQTVMQASSQTAVTSGLDPSVYGEAVTFTATVSEVAPGSGTPTGTVTFEAGSVTLGNAPLSGGSGTLTTSSLPAGTQSITVVYNGDANFAGSTSPVLLQTVAMDQTSTTLASSSNPVGAGKAVTFTATVLASPPGSGIPTGPVTFLQDGSTTLGTGGLNASGQATLTTTFSSLGVFTITAVYGGDNNFIGSTSAPLDQNVNRFVSLTAGSSKNPAVFGQAVTFTAVIAANPAGSYSGTVTWEDGSTTLGTSTVNSSGDATLTTSSLAVGIHSIIAVYSGNGTFAGATSSALSQTINTDGSATVVTSSVNPSVLGQTVTFTATVSASAPGAGTPTGTVTFKDGSATLGTGLLSAGGQATFGTSSLGAAKHSITAVYGGDANFAASTSAVFTETVIANSSTTMLGSSLDPSAFGQPVTFTATVSGGLGTPTGTVTFEDGGVTLGTGVLNGSGVTSFTTSGLAARAHSITAVYGGDSTYGASTSAPLSQTVAVDSTATMVAASSDPSAFGQSVTFTATVSAAAPGAGTPSGTVTFKNGSATLGTGTLSGGQATFTTSALVVGNSTVIAVYGGDANFSVSSSGALTQTVNPDGSTATVTSSVNPSNTGQSVTLTATVSAVAPGSGTPSGSVTFLDGSAALGTGSLSAQDKATFTTSGLSTGTHSITALYTGDANFTASTSAVFSQTVGQTGSTTTLAAAPDPTVFGQSVTFTATVSASSGTPTGTVIFEQGSTTLGSGTLGAGKATLATTTLPVGTDAITAIYGGDANFTGSTSAVFNQTVNHASTTTGISTSVNPSVFGQTVTFTATVSASTPGSGTPTGTVTFKDGSVTLGSAVLSGKTATLTTTALAIGIQSISAVYGGDANFTASTSGTLAQTVNQASTTSIVVSQNDPSVVGQPVTFTLIVLPAAPGAGVPTGTVTLKFTLRGSVGTATLVNGTATLTTSTLAEGVSSLQAAYNGDANFLTSNSTALTQTVNPDATSTTLVSSANPSNSGHAVTFTATVTANAPGSGTPTGSVTFKDGTTTLGSGSLNAGGVATFTTSSLSVGNHSITAMYNATTNYSTSTSPALTQTVTSGPAALLVTAFPAATGSANGSWNTVNRGSAILPPSHDEPGRTSTINDGAGQMSQDSGAKPGFLAHAHEAVGAESSLGSLDRFFASLAVEMESVDA